MMAGYVFLLLNGYELTAPEDEVVEMARGLATKEYSLDELDSWLCNWSRDFDSRQLCKERIGIEYCSIFKLD